ncbi:MAG: radical SAM protein [Nannocystaceae bacterium]
MRALPITTNETCDHRCAFCDARREVEDPAIAGSAALRARIDAAAGAEALILTGGEPTLRRDLPAIVAYARRRGPRVVLETHAARLDAAAIDALARAGLSIVRVHLPGLGDDADAITGDVGGSARTQAAIRAMHAAGIAVEANLPVSRETLATIAALPPAIAAAGLPVQALWARIVVDAPSSGSCPSLEELRDTLTSLAEAARAASIPLRLAPQALLPACVFPQPGRIAHLYALSPGGRERDDHRRLPGCERCVVVDRCPGFPRAILAREPDTAAAPITQDRLRRRLSVIESVEAQIERELRTEELFRRSDGVTERATTIRVNFLCNQACTFCFVSTHLPAAADDRIEAEIRRAAAGGGVVVLSGGEPTLNPRLTAWVALARSSGASHVELQSNAIRLADGDLAERLRDAGLSRCFISLHGATAATSDLVTQAPGTFVKTLAGIDAIVRAGLPVQLNFVICQANFRELPAYFDLVGGRWPSASVCVSFVGPSTDLVPSTAEVIPRYAEVMPLLAEGLQRARRHGTLVEGFESMCGIPLCLVPADLDPFLGLAAIPEGFDRGEFIKAEACRGCDLEDRCFGVRRRYAALYGADELRPIRRP